MDRLLPILAVEGAVLHGLGNVFHLDLLLAAEVGDGARNLQNAIVGPGRKRQPPDRHFQVEVLE